MKSSSYALGSKAISSVVTAVHPLLYFQFLFLFFTIVVAVLGRVLRAALTSYLCG
jgi:hypothetical protein